MNKFKDLLINGIDDDIQGATSERLQEVRKAFESAMIYGKRVPSVEICQEWLQGLPSEIHFPWENYKIMEWYENLYQRKIEPGVPVRGCARYETLLENYWPKLGAALYTLLYK